MQHLDCSRNLCSAELFGDLAIHWLPFSALVRGTTGWFRPLVFAVVGENFSILRTEYDSLRRQLSISAVSALNGSSVDDIW